MPTDKQSLIIAITISAILVLFNIIAVTSGSAEPYYSKLDQVIFNIQTVP